MKHVITLLLAAFYIMMSSASYADDADYISSILKQLDKKTLADGNDIYISIKFPTNADGEYKAMTAGMVYGCLYECVNESKEEEARVKQENCKSLCDCIVKGLIPTMPPGSDINDLPPESIERGDQAMGMCYKKYQN